MKKIYALLIIMTIFVTACQKTPEELVVQNKAGDEMQNLINATDNPNEPQNSGNSEIVVATDHITKKTTNDLGTIIANVDTDVYMPNVNELPVVTVERGSFTQEQVNKFIEVLMGNATLYSTDSPLTKDQITEEIIKIKQSATDLNSDMAKSEGITSLSELEKRANEIIKVWEAKYASAPDSADNSMPDTDVTTQILYNGEGTGTYVNVSANLGKKDMAILSLTKFTKGEELAFSNYNNYGTKEHDIYSSVSAGSGIIEGFNMSCDDAQKLVADTLSDLNLDKDFKLGNTYIGKSTNIGDEENKQYYIFYFERIINDVAVTHDFRRIGKTSNEDPAYAEPLQFENLEMWVDDTGIVQVCWDAPLQINEVVNNNVEVKIDAEQATDVITKQLFLQYGDLYSGQAEKIEIEITGIRLGLARIRYRGNPGEYILVPVWDFYGDVKIKVNESASGQLIDELNKEGGLVHPKVDGMYIFNIPFQSIGTINALDGTIINRDLGY